MWNDDRVERLTSLFRQGMSASVIAESLGGFEHTKDKGRNAVIGKLHRLGLKSGQQIIRRARYNQNKKPRSQAPKIAPAKIKTVRLGNTAFRQLLETTEPLPPPAETDIPRVSFRDLDRRQHCGWVCVEAPKGELISSLDAPVYCGCKPVPGLSYCEHHARRAFQSPEPRNAPSYRRVGPPVWRDPARIDPRTLEEVEA